MTDADQLPQRLCICCQRARLEPTQPQTCHRCVGDTRRWLTNIVTLYAALAASFDGYPRRHTSGVRDTPRGGGDALPGGDRLTLLAYGSDGGNADEGSRHDVDDAPSVVWELERWEADWRHVQGLAAATTPATVTNTSGWLLAHLTWASQHHPAFDDFHHDMRRLHRQLEQATSSGEQAHRTRTPCLHCGAQLVRYWRDPKFPGDPDGGLADEADCPHCHRHYDERQFIEARKQALADEEVGV